jgi:hypothetical protein
MLTGKSIIEVRIRAAAICLTVLVGLGCDQKQAGEGVLKAYHADRLQQCNDELTKVIITDVLSPPVCSRIYAYCNIAAYEAIRPMSNNLFSYAGKLNGLATLPTPDTLREYYFPISSVVAFNRVAEKLVFNPAMVREFSNKYLHALDSIGVEKNILKNSVEFGSAVAEGILEWASRDGYHERNAYPAYLVTRERGAYVPIPPDYIDAMEPHWGKLRPFVLDSASQFRPGPPVAYDTSKTSPFFKQALEVYQVTRHPVKEDSVTAWYWDDNPNTSVTQGHVKYFQQKMSPGGHWIHIACDISDQEVVDPVRKAAIVSQTAIALAEAFISCWESKYYYKHIRPVTFIHKYIDPDWQPIIQTPPFPEYIGGHGAISASAATILTGFFGDGYAFTDSTELPYGRPPRAFLSFYEAADQANMSRLYGGIHFRQSLEEASKHGKEVGNFVRTKLSMREDL